MIKEDLLGVFSKFDNNGVISQITNALFITRVKKKKKKKSKSQILAQSIWSLVCTRS